MAASKQTSSRKAVVRLKDADILIAGTPGSPQLRRTARRFSGETRCGATARGKQPALAGTRQPRPEIARGPVNAKRRHRREKSHPSKLSLIHYARPLLPKTIRPAKSWSLKVRRCYYSGPSRAL